MKETIHYIADIRYVSAITSNRYSSKRQVVEEHIRYIEKSANYEFGNKELVLKNSEKYNKRVNSRVAGKTVFALPNDIKRDEYQKWCKYIQSVLAENFGINPEYIYIAIHENHTLQKELNTKNIHAHVVFTPVAKNGKAIQTKISDLKAIHQKWKDILRSEGYKVKKEPEGIGKLGRKLRKDEELLNSYRDYLQAKQEQQQALKQAKHQQTKNMILSAVAGRPQQMAEIEIVELEYSEKPQPQLKSVSKQMLHSNRSEGIYQEAPKTYQSIPEHTTPEQNIPQHNTNISEQNTVKQKSTRIYQNIPEQREKRKKEIQSLLAGKSLAESIGVVRKLWNSETDSELKIYLENILKELNKKATEILKQRQPVWRPEPGQSEIRQSEPIQRQPVYKAEPEQKPEAEPAKSKHRQTQERNQQTRQPIQETVCRKPEPAEHTQPEQRQQREIKTFKDRAKKFMIVKEAILNAIYEDPEKGIELLEMIEKEFKGVKGSRIVEELISEKPYLEVLVEFKQKKNQKAKEEQQEQKFEKPSWEPPAPA